MKANPLTQNLAAEHLLQHMPVSTFVLNAKHQVVLWNKACEQLTGLKAREMIGTDQHWRGFYTEKRPCLADLLLDRTLGDVSSLYERASDFTTYSDICHTENWCLMPDGRRLYLVIDAGIISNEQGEVVAIVETQRDRTEQRLTMQALSESEQRISLILGSAMDAIVTIDQQHRITLFNAAAARIFRCAADFAIGQPVELFIAPHCSKLFMQFIDFENASAKTQAWAPEGLSARRADGEEFPIEATFSPLETHDQKLYTIILRDVNDRRLAEQKLDRLQQEKGYLQEVLNDDHNPGDFVSGSKLMRTVMEQVRMVARTDTPVLLLGETGTGKELLARAIHEFSDRSAAIMVKVNCAALPAELIESELFGHEKGAFTGATQQRKGRFELADGGSLFLDELGELSLSAQAKLLRVLQEQEFERVGGCETIRVDVRVIAATHRNLAEEVSLGRFRSDLYYRLNVFPVEVPALRQRVTDIPLLARFFLTKYAKKFGKRFDDIDPAGLDYLRQYAWPGNVRELQNVIERAVILSQGSLLNIAPLQPTRTHAEAITGKLRTLEAVEREHITQTLEAAHWQISGAKGAAAILGMNPNTLRSKMLKLGISRSG
ncbi:MAG: sigma 54-interacting transcriptional regulator [Methylobacter sp.]|nr:sigma 54-interacting transcriptional regulator [Methylobacter sp.]MDP2100825.1 sigma 54-interacting transcriptional regulator [Methylobacter sp.]MDP2430391.1 sigma 54-interacting transcriptional regulator [Methylobacter sp.]MDP3055622.1 sigma 54-interacting transcriptional regulator [Methylobacter sp.]MDP3362047.1 sigma 54-interacting transcriptional regulator [Methylobacter sp.]